MTNNTYYLLDGFKLILQPGLKRFVIIPLLINILLFIGLFFLAIHFFNEFNHWLILHLPSWLYWLGSLLWLIFFIGFFLAFLYTFTTLANFIAAPFNSILAEKVEWFLTGKSLAKQSALTLVKDIPRIITRQFSIIGFYLPRACLLLILFFIPLVQLVAPVLWFVFNAWFMTLQYVDYPTDNHRIPLSKVRQRLQRKRWPALSFGVSVLLLTMVPLLNCFVMPAAVAGATKMWLKEFT